MMVRREFDRFAASYGEYNMIQKAAAKRLIEWIGKDRLGSVLDLGCGTGELYRQLKKQNIAFDRFIAADVSREMLARHPRTSAVEILPIDFSDPSALRSLDQYRLDLLLSSSALQWSRNLGKTLEELSSLGVEAYFSLFTSNTFRTLLKEAGVVSPIPDAEKIRELVEAHYRIERLERVEYRLGFESTREMFRYIKRSGVSGGERKLGYRETRELMQRYPLEYLEFEVIFFHVFPKNRSKKSHDFRMSE